MLVDDLNQQEAFEASQFISSVFDRTPLLPANSLLETLKERNSRLNGVIGRLWLKFDNVEHIGAFKSRGARYFLERLSQEGTLTDYVVAASTGNHAQGVALAAKNYGISAVIFMPEDAPDVKKNNVERLGGEVRVGGENYSDCVAAAKTFASENGAVNVPAYEHPHIIYGQSSVGFEIFQQLARVEQTMSDGRSFAMPIGDGEEQFMGTRPDVIIAPIGGGGLISGIGLATHYHQLPGTSEITQVYGVQSSASNSMIMSLAAQEVVESTGDYNTIADGINVPEASKEMLRCLIRYTTGEADVDEVEIRDAIKLIYNDNDLRECVVQATAEVGDGANLKHGERLGRLNIVEPAGAVPIAALASGKFNQILYNNSNMGHNPLEVVCVLSGGNINPALLNEIVQ